MLVRKAAPSVCRLNLSLVTLRDACIGVGDDTVCDDDGGDASWTVDFPDAVASLDVFRNGEGAFYNVTVRQIDCGSEDGNVPFAARQEFDDCNRFYDAGEFVLQSPGYPRAYEPDTDCTATVFPSGPDVCSLELRFDEFDVEASEVLDECANDYLEISDDRPLARTMR